MSKGRLVLWWIAGAGAVLYLLNPTAGLFELLPDVLPGVGNLDEAAATGLLIASARGIAAARRERLAARGVVRIQPSAQKSGGSPPDTRTRS